MARIVLIHGFANGLETFFRERPKLGELEAFAEKIDSGEAVLFEWFNEYRLELSEMLSPEPVKKIYLEEKRKARSAPTLLKLHNFLMQHEPEVIVAFSMGCYLTANYINKYSLPECVKNITFIQADLAIDFNLKDTGVSNRMRSGNLVWQNYWCPWDPTLSISTFVNKKKRLGLGEAKNPLIRNRFYPLYKHPNLHVSSIKDLKIVNEVLKAKTIPDARL